MITGLLIVVAVAGIIGVAAAAARVLVVQHLRRKDQTASRVVARRITTPAWPAAFVRYDSDPDQAAAVPLALPAALRTPTDVHTALSLHPWNAGSQWNPDHIPPTLRQPWQDPTDHAGNPAFDKARMALWAQGEHTGTTQRWPIGIGRDAA